MVAIPFLTVNGYEVKVWVRSGSEEAIEIGGGSRAYSGNLRGTRRATKREWPFATAEPLAYNVIDADALQALILGEGHYWSFDSDLYSSKGLGPVSSADATQSGSSGKYGGKVSIDGDLAYQAALGDEWTVLVYRLESMVWVYYAVRSDGAKWVDGTRNDSATTTWLDVTDGTVTITDTTRDYDELIALPYQATADMIEAWQALTVAFSDLPKLNVSGDFVRSKTVECLGELGTSPFSQAPGKQRVEFRLREV